MKVSEQCLQFLTIFLSTEQEDGVRLLSDRSLLCPSPSYSVLLRPHFRSVCSGATVQDSVLQKVELMLIGAEKRSTMLKLSIIIQIIFWIIFQQHYFAGHIENLPTEGYELAVFPL